MNILNTLNNDQLEKMIDSMLPKDRIGKEDLDRHIRYEKVKKGTIEVLHFCEGVEHDKFFFKIEIDAQTEFISSSGDIIVYGTIVIDKRGEPLDLFILKREKLKECINSECKQMMPALAKFCSECGEVQPGL